MLASVRALEGLILIKKTQAPASGMSLVSVMNTFGLVLMLADCAPPGPSLTCSTETYHIENEFLKYTAYFLCMHVLNMYTM